MSAQAPSSGRKDGPQRTCIGCRRKSEQRKLLRLVRSPEGEVVVDHPHRLGGRGVYVCSTSACLSKALRSSQLPKQVGGPVVVVSSTLTGQIHDRICGRIDGLLASAGKARKVVMGATKVEELLRDQKARACLVVLAQDVSARVRGDIEAAAERAAVPVVVFGDLDLLGRALARNQLGVVALTDRGLAEAIRWELTLLEGFSAASEEQSTKKATSPREDEALERAT